MTSDDNDGCGKFIDIIAADFDNVKHIFINKCNAMEYEFDEDLFMDVFINCHNKLLDKLMTKSECIKYYWVAYLNKYKTEKSKESRFIGFEDIKEQKSILNTYNYNPIIDNDYNQIIELVRNKFDKDYVDAWLLHICDDKSYKELNDMGYNFKFNDIFKRINKYVRKEFKK